MVNPLYSLSLLADLIIGSDLAYEAEAAEPLWQAIVAHIGDGPETAFIMAHELRREIRATDQPEARDEALEAMIAVGLRRGFTMHTVPVSSLWQHQVSVCSLVYVGMPAWSTKLFRCPVLWTRYEF